MTNIKESYTRLFENNKKWVEQNLARDPDFFSNLAREQKPDYLFIGCSDSRVPSNEITGTEAGEMFVHRNIANMVIHTDLNLMAVLQYSVEVLKVKHVIVCGHYGCGGVKASMDHHYHGIMDKWLQNIKDVYRLNRAELDALDSEESRFRKLVELNVREQVYHLYMTSIVQRAKAKGQPLEVHGWVYDLHEGLLRDLNINTEKDFPEIELYRYTDLV
jgi:carbonic anhydrase